jgi:hypothetical protein
MRRKTCAKALEETEGAVLTFETGWTIGQSVNLGSLRDNSGIRLNRRFRSAQAFTVEPSPVEAANASLPGSEHRAGIFDTARACL